MDTLNLWLPLIGVGIFWAIAVGAWFADKKIPGLWFGFAGAAGKKILVIYGATGYITVNEPHYTWHCFYLIRDRGAWRLGSAPIGNNAN